MNEPLLFQSGNDVTFTCTLPESHAFALAQLCKRIGYDDCRQLAANTFELQQMLDATTAVRRALETVRVYVR